MMSSTEKEIREKDIQLQNLEAQKSLQQDLANAQLEQLLLKQRQLELLEAKLAALEAMESKKINQNLSKEDDKLTESADQEKDVVVVQDAQVDSRGLSSVGLATAFPFNLRESSSITLIDEENNNTEENQVQQSELSTEESQFQLMQEMMNNPEFLEKIAVLQRQSQELAYLEDQLKSLKELKSKMIEKQEMMVEITQAQADLLQVEKTATDAKNEALLEKVEDILQESSPVDRNSFTFNSEIKKENDIEVLEPLGPNTANLSELGLATKAMEQYLTFQRQQRKQFNRESPSKEIADETLMLDALMERLLNASVAEDEMPESEEKQEKQSRVSFAEKLVEIKEDDPVHSEQNQIAEDEIPESEEKQENQARVSFAEKLVEIKEDDPVHPEQNQIAEDEIPEEIDEKEDKELEEDTDGLAEDTSAKIENAIKQLAFQIEDVKDAEKFISNSEERTYYDSVLSKMTSQLEELLELREKMMHYEELLTLAKQEKLNENIINGTAAAAESTSIPSKEVSESFVVEKQTAVEIEQNDEKETTETFVRVEKQTQESNCAMNAMEIQTMKKSESLVIPSTSDYIPFPNNAQELRKYRPSLISQMQKTTADESSVADSRKSVGSSRAKRLFQKHRSAIYESASSLIEAYESKPHFLLSLFKKLHQFADNEVSQQQLLLFLDDLVEETEMEQVEDSLYGADESNEGIDTESELLKSLSRSAQLQKDATAMTRHNLHVAIQTYIASMVIANPSLSESYTSEIMENISRHVCSLLYTELTSPDSSRKTYDSEFALNIVDEYKPILGSIMNVYSGSAIKENWTRLVDDLHSFMNQCLDWTESKMGFTLDQQIDHLLDSLLQFLEGDINDRFIARKKIDEQRRLLKLRKSYPGDTSEKKKTLKDLCGIITRTDEIGHFEKQANSFGQTRLKNASDVTNNHNGSSMKKAPYVSNSRQEKRLSSFGNMGHKELLDFLRTCPRRTASISEINKTLPDLARRNGYNHLKDYLRKLDRDRVVRAFIEKSKYYIQLSDDSARSFNEKGRRLPDEPRVRHFFASRKLSSRPSPSKTLA